mgnify:CR=1 FL=1
MTAAKSADIFDMYKFKIKNGVICMKKTLIVIDMQNDFIDGSLGTDEAVKIMPNVTQKD